MIPDRFRLFSASKVDFRSARLGAQPGDRHPENAGGVDRRHFGRGVCQLQIRRFGETVEIDGKVVRREDLAEGHRGRQRRHLGHECVVDLVPTQGGVDELAERIRTCPGDHRRPATVARRRDGHVCRAATQIFTEGGDLVEADADLLRIDVHADPAHGQHLVRLAHARTCATSTGRPVSFDSWHASAI